jgi:hypothetical protein
MKSLEHYDVLTKDVPLLKFERKLCILLADSSACFASS